MVCLRLEINCVLLCFVDPRVRKIRNEASSCPGIFSRTLRFHYVASSPGSPLQHLLDGHRKLVGRSAIPARSCPRPCHSERIERIQKYAIFLTLLIFKAPNYIHFFFVLCGYPLNNSASLNFFRWFSLISTESA